MFVEVVQTGWVEMCSTLEHQHPQFPPPPHPAVLHSAQNSSTQLQHSSEDIHENTCAMCMYTHEQTATIQPNPFSATQTRARQLISCTDTGSRACVRSNNMCSFIAVFVDYRFSTLFSVIILFCVMCCHVIFTILGDPTSTHHCGCL